MDIRKCVAVAAAMAAGIGFGATIDLAQTGDLALAALNDADTYVNAGAETRTLTVTCAANVTNSCQITGNIRLVKAGSATLGLSNGSNDYTGGTDVQAGILDMTAAGALGSGQIDVGSASAASQVRFSAPGGSTIANAIHVRASSGTYPAISINGGGSSSSAALSFTGSITADGDLYMLDDGNWVARKSTDTTEGLYANTKVGFYSGAFRGAVTVNGDVLEVVPRCKLYFYGKITAPCFRIGKEESLNTIARGQAHVCNTDNAVGKFQCNYSSFYAGAADGFKGAVLDWSHKFSSSAGEAVRGFYNMNGYDQHIAYFKGAALPETARSCYVVGNYDTQKTPTLTLSGSGVPGDEISSDVWLYYKSNDSYSRSKFNLCLDAPDFTYALNGSFPTRPNTGVASLRVANGTLRATGYASFPNATALSVGTNAVFSLESITNDALAAAVNVSIATGGVLRVASTCGANPFGSARQMILSLDSHATFEIPAGRSIYVAELWIDGVRHAGGEYSGTASGDVQRLEQLSGEGKIVVNAYVPSVISRTWAGAGADHLTSTAENWDGASLPTLDDGSLIATFATGGTRAELDTDVSFNGIVFDLPANASDFTIANSSGTERVKLGERGITTVAGNDSSYVASIDAPMQLLCRQTWGLGAGTELVATQAISVLSDAVFSLAVNGADSGVSRLRLSAANAFSGLTVSNCHVSVDSSAGGAFGAPGIETLLWMTKSEFTNGAASAMLTLGGKGAVFDNDIRFNILTTPAYVIRVAENTTNTFEKLGFYSLGNVNRAPYLVFDEGSRTVVNKGIDTSWAPITFKGAGRVELMQKISSGSHVNIGSDATDSLHVVFNAPNSTAYTFIVRDNCTLDLRTDYAAVVNSDHPSKNISVLGTVLIHDTTQYFWRLVNGGTIRGEAGGQVVLGGVYTNNAAGVNTWFDGVNCATKFADAASVSLRHGRYNFTGVSQTVGDLTLTNGWARFQTGSMTNVQTVTVADTGILELRASGRFGEESVWRVGGNGLIKLNTGVRQECGRLFLTDISEEMPRRPGVYGSAEAHAADSNVIADSHFEGPGVLVVKGAGTVMIFR